MTNQLPILRWGIIGTGYISSRFAGDLVLRRPDARANHIVQAVGSSSMEKGMAWVNEHLPGFSPTVCSYAQVYANPNVDIVYVGTPHAFHRANCLDAINAGKHVLCEKPLTINAREAEDIFQAARQRGVFVMEGQWTRFYPLTRTLISLLHEQKVIGGIRRSFCDFSLAMDVRNFNPRSRLINPLLGAGSLLDLGIYSIMWALLATELNVGSRAQVPTVSVKQTLHNGVDITTSGLLHFPSGSQAVVSCSYDTKTTPTFCTIHGTLGYIEVEGIASAPESFNVYLLRSPRSREFQFVRKFEFPKPGRGFYYEADAVALDIAAGRVQNDIVPWDETLRVLRLMDEMRRQGGVTYPQDQVTLPAAPTPAAPIPVINSFVNTNRAANVNTHTSTTNSSDRSKGNRNTKVQVFVEIND